MAMTPIIHVYKEVNIGKYATVRHFELQETLNGLPQFSTLLNVSNNRDFANSKPIYWAKERKGGVWVRPNLTGLFKTNLKSLFWGDANHKKHLLLFRFEKGENKLIIFYFKNHFSNDLSEFILSANRSYNKQKRMV